MQHTVDRLAEESTHKPYTALRLAFNRNNFLNTAKPGHSRELTILRLTSKIRPRVHYN